ncbi:MAG: D-Ala-D-Ala dipeptidase [Proteobacteria bacterium]|nr:D-Ala-D-Ala dipeptidase [Pseudomonadota bacterium]
MANDDLRRIAPSDLIALDDFTADYPLKIDLVYAQKQHPDNMFKTAIYRPDAKMWGHRDLVQIILQAAQICFKETGWIFEAKDCLRTVESQILMRNTEIVKAHPQWLEEPGRLLSPPGKGGHPRGMAVDIVLVDLNGDEIDMGTSFDYLTPDRNNNPAARNYTALSSTVMDNRRVLEESMMQAAKEAGRELLPLPQEWWDFRFPAAYTSLFEPICDTRLPPEMRMTVL